MYFFHLLKNFKKIIIISSRHKWDDKNRNFYQPFFVLVVRQIKEVCCHVIVLDN